MKLFRTWTLTGLAATLLLGGVMAYAPEADAGVRIIRRGSACPAPGYYQPRRHVHSYAYQQQRVFVGYDPCGYPVYEIRYVRVRTCGC